jgi:serine/threonine protein kinase
VQPGGEDPLIGFVMGRYVVRSRLAQGGMGAIYVLQHEKLAARKIMKVLLPEYARNEVIRERFEREATASSALKKQKILAADDFGSLPDGQLFYTMPFLDGRALDAHIAQNGVLTLHHTFHIIVQLCLAVEQLHARGIVHRDLKPGNVFIVETDENPYEVILLDLGIARDIAGEATTPKRTHAGIALGTPGYMSVEQFSDAANATPAADIYALAVITWEMLTGQTPWGIHDPRVLYHLQMTEVPEPPAGHILGAEVLALLRKTLLVDPEERPTSARAFAVALASLIAPIPPHVPSGAEILARYATRLVVQAGPQIETVRNVSNVDAATPLVWPYRSTQVPMLPQEVPVSAAAATPIQPATVPARPNAEAVRVAAPLTTIGASSGVIAAVAPAPERDRRRLLLGLAAAFVVACAVFGVVVATRATSSGSAARVDTDAPSNVSNSGPSVVPVLDAGTIDAPMDAQTDASVDASLAMPTNDASTPKTPRVKPSRGSGSAPRQGSGAASGSGTTPIDPDAVVE